MVFFNKFKGNENIDTTYSDTYSKQLELQITDLRAQLEGIKKYVSESEGKNKGLEQSVIGFCRSLLEREFALSQIGGSEENILNMNVPQLLDFTARKIMSQKTEQNQKMLSAITELDEKSNIIDDLKNQITQFLANKDLSKKEILEIVLDRKISQTEDKYSMDKGPVDSTRESEKIIDETKPVESIKSITINNPMLNAENNIRPIKKEKELVTDVIKESPKKEEESIRIIEVKDEDLVDKKNLKPVIKIDNNTVKDKPKTIVKSDEVIAHVMDLSQIMNNMAEIHWKIVEAIGVKGLSEKTDMTHYLSGIYTDIEISSLEQKIENALNEMKISNVVVREKVNTGWRIFYVYSLSDTGKRVFKESNKFERELAMCERDELVKQHSTPNHGYGIKDCANMLLDLGYTDVTYDSKTNRVELPNGDIYVPDIIAKDPLTGQKEYFEYELVHHKQSDFDIKCNKMRKVTSHLHFIVPDVKKRARINTQIDEWRFKMGEKVKDVKVSTTTTRNLKKNMWDTDD